uniref:Uncharacterized protein n=1 Tax=Spongospora subterranea TaxID=70186 RepID=A0A0H5QR83_9EUKA|eukprot:CRZ04117.1 hypothetical protein [Spongospora subterranea]
MIDAHGYTDEAAVYNELIAGLKRQARHDKDVRKKIKEAVEHLDTFYANEVALNPVPQTYLYGAYQRRFRYFKLFQMFQKLAIVLVSLFIPNDLLVKNAKLALGNVLVGLAAILAILFRPYQVLCPYTVTSLHFPVQENYVIQLCEVANLI